jgi:hypothetical protein
MALEGRSRPAVESGEGCGVLMVSWDLMPHRLQASVYFPYSCRFIFLEHAENKNAMLAASKAQWSEFLATDL